MPGRSNATQGKSKKDTTGTVPTSDDDSVSNDDIRSILKDLTNQMKEMNNRISVVSDEIKSLKATQEEVAVVKETANSALENSVANADEIDHLKKELSLAKDHIKVLESACENIHSESVQLDAYSRRDNLLFDKIPEQANEVCADIITKFCCDSLKMDQDEVRNMKIVRCHRLGRPKPGQSRSIICRFHYFGDRQEVWNHRSNLKGTNYRIREDFPPEIVAKRNILAPVMYEARKHDLKAFLVVDKLRIGDKMYTVDTLDELPENINVTQIGTTKVTNNITAFYGASCPLSNFYPAAFTDDKGIRFKHSEQYLHYHKAKLFNDKTTAERIMATSAPSECKFLGSKVVNFDKKVWKDNAKDIMKVGLTLKFSQNPVCFRSLQATKNARLVEAAPNDTLWGVGLHSKEEAIKNPTLWKGNNYMGELLQDIRAELVG